MILARGEATQATNEREAFARDGFVFEVRDDRDVAFEVPRERPLAILGIRVAPAGTLSLNPHDLTPLDVRLEALRVAPEDSAALAEDDWEDPIRPRLVALALAAWSAVAREQRDALAALHLDMLDRAALAWMAAVAHWQACISGANGPPRDAAAWRSLLDGDTMALDGVDARFASCKLPFTERPGYLVVREGRAIANSGWAPSKGGWIGRLVFETHARARRAASGNDEIVRIRIAAGRAWRVTEGGRAPCEAVSRALAEAAEHAA